MTAFREITMGKLIRETALKFPDNDALIYPDINLRLSYQELLEKTIGVAKGFMALGIQNGDHVSVWTTNIPEWVYMQFGLGMIGAVLVTVNTNYKSNELEYILNQSDSTTLVLMEEYRDTNFYKTTQEVIPELDTAKPGKLDVPKLPDLKNVIYIGNRKETPGMFSFDQIFAMGKDISDERASKTRKHGSIQ